MQNSGNMDRMISAGLEQCIADMRETVHDAKMTLEAQTRAYDLLGYLLEAPAGEVVTDGCGTASEDDARTGMTASAEAFLSAYSECSEALAAAYDETHLRAESDALLEPFRKALKEAEDRLKTMTDLHDCAKKTYEIWTGAGFFARQKALRILRQKAGFRLESKRIGNYVAKTFDLMNEAAAAYARAQQALFAADRSYKIRPGIYGEIAAALKPKRS